MKKRIEAGKPLISVVMPTYNRLHQLTQVIKALEEQTFPKELFEVNVISDGSTDGTEAYLETIDTELSFRMFTQKNQGAAAARNNGIHQSRGDIIVFIDDDVVPIPDFLAEHAASHAKSGPDVVVIGPMLMPNNCELTPWVGWEQAMLDKQYADMAAGLWEPTARQFYTGNASIARSHLLNTGGFDIAFRRAEDVELAYRLAERGMRFEFNQRAIGYHHADRSFASWINTPYEYGRNDVIFARDKGQHWLLPTLVREYDGRHRLIKALVRLCLSRPIISKVVLALLKAIATIGHRLDLTLVPQHVYSGIFNLRHYQGVADELGSRTQFFQLLNDFEAAQRFQSWQVGESNA